MPDKPALLKRRTPQIASTELQIAPMFWWEKIKYFDKG